MKFEIKTLKDPQALTAYAADRFAELAEENIAKRGAFNVALSGGSTPLLLYEKLLLQEVKWDAVTFFWSDERFVPFEHPESNAGNAYRRLLSPLQIDRSRFFPVPTELADARSAAWQYETTLRAHFKVLEQVPRFDLILLGLGSDGHTASLFPDTAALEENRRLVAANWVEGLKAWRITFTYPLINASHHVIFIVAGKEKAEAVRRVIKEGDARLPAARVCPESGSLSFLLDAEAAALL